MTDHKQTNEEKEYFGGKTKEELAALIKRVKLSPEQRKEFDKMARETVDNLNRNVHKEEKASFKRILSNILKRVV